MTEYPDVEHIRILNGPMRLQYGGPRFPEDGARWVDSGREAPEAINAIDEMCTFIRAHTA